MDINTINTIIWNIDDEEGILDYQLPNGLCIWLLVRYHVYTLLFKKSIKKYQCDGNANNNSEEKNVRFLNRLFSYWGKSFLKNPFVLRKDFDCINICSSIGCYSTPRGYRSRMTGFLNDFKGLKTLNVIRSDNGVYKKYYEGSYCFYDSILLKEKVWQKLSNKRTQRQWHQLTKLLKEKLTPYLSITELEGIDNLISLYSIEYIGMEKSFRKLLSNTRPKLVLIEDANYGSLDNCTLIMVAKQLNIKTSEVQHGVFDIGFQYSKRILENRLLAFHKTDYILTFGDYFSEFIQSSSKNISMGNRFLEDQKRALKRSTLAGEEKKILFVTQRDFTDRLIPIVYTALKGLTKKFKLVIRLHPSESGFPLKYKQLGDLPGTTFSISDNVYEQIVSSDFIIGSYSTLLTESIYFDKHPLIHRNDLSDRFIPDGIGMRFSTPQELIDLLSSVVPRQVKEEKEYYWKYGCEENFARFYEEEIGNAYSLWKNELLKKT